MLKLGWLVAMAGLLLGASGAGAQVPIGSAAPSLLRLTPEQQQILLPAVETAYRVNAIKRGDRVRPLPLAASQIDPSRVLDGTTWSVDSYMRAHRVSGLLVLKDGEILLERYGLGRGPTDRWISYSVAKSVTSTLVGAAVQDGKLSIDAPITRYLPELKGTAYDGATVRHLVTMSSGVRWNEDYSDPNSDVARVSAPTGEPGHPILNYLKKVPREHAPGTTFHYNTAETDLVGLIVSRATGEALADYASRKIWKPYGMERDANWLVDAQGHERGGCCISMTLRDYARFGQFMLEGGIADGKRILPDGWIDKATTPQITNGARPPGYGYFWWMRPQGYAALGIFGQAIVIYPRERIVVAFNSAWPSAGDETLWVAQSAVADALRLAAMRSEP